MKDGIIPCVEMDFNGIWDERIDIGIDTKVGATIDIQRCDANRKVGGG